MSLSGKDYIISNWELWQAIRDAPLPGGLPQKGLFGRRKAENFEEQLASKHNLTEESAQRLVEEYRRFLYLKAIDGGSLSPSKRVDQAWHLHIETPRGEWSRFCDEVLKCQIVHQTGLSATEAKSNYARLFDLYRRECNQEPPSDIWPGARERRRSLVAAGIAITGLVLFIGGTFFEPYVGSSLPIFGFIAFIVSGVIASWVGAGTDLETVSNCA